MPAPVVYEGVEACEEGGGGGPPLFKNIKFWVAQRVPLRSRFISDIKANGGEIVPLEKQADILIADDARKDAPPNSYSWKFIEDCVKKGVLVDKDPFLIGRNTPAARPVGSSRPAKGTRNPFTSNDDEILTKWVLRKELRGEPTLGNVIYQELEEKCPRHPWQSWRYRWCKYLRHRPRKEYPAEELMRSPSPPPAATAMPTESAAPAPMDSGQPLPSPAQPSPSLPRSSMPSKGRVKFTPEDDALLVRFVQEKENAGQASLGNKIYVELAEEFPHHTWQSWRDRYVKYLRPLRDGEAEDAAANNTPRQAQASRPAAQSPANLASRNAASPDAASASRTLPSATPREGRTALLSDGSAMRQSRTATGSPASLEIKKQVQERARKQEQARRIREAAKTIQRVWRGHVARQRVAALRQETEQVDAVAQSAWEGSAAHRQIAQPQQDQEGAADLSQENGVATDIPGTEQREAPTASSATDAGLRIRTTEAQSTRNLTVKEQFYSDLRDYLQWTEKRINLWPKILNRSVDLWDLYEAVMSETENSGHCDWQRVAEILGYDWVQHPSVIQEVAKCYDDNLAEFVKIQLEFEAEAEESIGDESPDSDAEEIPRAHALEAAARAPSDSPLPSSPPRVGGLKRRFDITITHSDVVYPSESSRKRARVDHGREIPSTPEHEMGALHYTQMEGASGTPTRRRVFESSGRVELDDLDELDDERSSQQLPPLPQPASRRISEPETRDFHYGPDAVAGDDKRQVEDVSPSQQQLRSEAGMGISPIPLKLPKNAAASKTPAGSQVRDFAEKPRRASSRQSTSSSSLPPVEKIVPPKPRRSLPQSFARLQPNLPVAQPGPSQVAPPAPPEPSPPRKASEKPGSSGSSRLTAAALQTLQSQIRTPPSSKRPSPPAQRPQTTSNLVVLSDSADEDDDEDDNGEALAATVERYMSMGYPQDVIMRALRATTGVADGLAGVVMESLMKGEGIPPDYEGVWTIRDDDLLALLGTIDWGHRPRTEEEKQRWRRAERARKRLVFKHGEARMEDRKKFLRVYRAG